MLPLENFSADPQQEYFADWMTEALITDLARIDGLRVISRTSSMHYKGQRKPLPEIAQELGVEAIVEGSVAQAGGRVRITAQLIDASTDAHLWAQSYDRPLRDVLSLQAEVATAIARQVNVTLTPWRQERFAARRAVDPVAYELYLKGRHAWDLRTAEGFDSAIRYFEHAIAKDPGFARAHAGLADTYSLLSLNIYGTSSPRETMSRAKAAAERALALDEGLAEAHTSLASVRHRYDWDWAAADRSFRRALELNAGDATAHQWYSVYLAEQGRDGEALAEARAALELGPLSANKHRSLGVVHHHARRFELAEAAERRSLELEPDSLGSRLVLAWSLIDQGRHQAAIDVLGQAPSSQNQDEVLATLAHAYTRAGQPTRASEIRRQLLARQPPATPASLVRLHIGLGDSDAGFRALERALEERSGIVTTLKVNPLFDPLRSDPRFRALLRRVNLS